MQIIRVYSVSPRGYTGISGYSLTKRNDERAYFTESKTCMTEPIRRVYYGNVNDSPKHSSLTWYHVSTWKRVPPSALADVRLGFHVLVPACRGTTYHGRPQCVRFYILHDFFAEGV